MAGTHVAWSVTCEQRDDCQAVLKDWYAPGFTSYAKKYCEQCLMCQQHNPGKAVQTAMSTHPPPQGLFEALHIDFIHMLKCDGYGNVLVLALTCSHTGPKPGLVRRLIPPL